MHSTLLILFLTIVLIACREHEIELSEESKRSIELEVRHVFNELVSASSALDSDRYFKYIDADKFVGLNADGSNWNSIIELKKVVEPGFNAVKEVQSTVFTNVKVSVIDLSTAILVNEYEQKVLLKTGESIMIAGGGTQVWSKANGNWMLVSISASNRL